MTNSSSPATAVPRELRFRRAPSTAPSRSRRSAGSRASPSRASRRRRQATAVSAPATAGAAALPRYSRQAVFGRGSPSPGVAARPERRVRPTSLLVVEPRSRAEILGVLALDVRAIPFEAAWVAAQQIEDRERADLAGVQRFEDPGRGERIDRRRGVAGGEPAIPADPREPLRARRPHRDARLRSAAAEPRRRLGRCVYARGPAVRVPQTVAANQIGVAHPGHDDAL